MKYQKFYELDIWKLGFELQKEIFELTCLFPKDERFGLKPQMNKSANSIIANIAESHGRFHYADKIRVLYISRGEIEETQSHLIVAQSRKYITRDKCISLIERYEKLKIKLNNYISDFVDRKAKSK